MGDEVEVESRAGDYEIHVRKIENLYSAHHVIHHDREYCSTKKLIRTRNGEYVITTEPRQKLERTSKTWSGLGFGLKRITSRASRRDSTLTLAIKTHEGTELSALKFTKVDSKRTMVTFVCNLELGFTVSSKAAARSLIKALFYTTRAASYFINFLASENIHDEDAHMLGEELIWRVNERSKRVKKEDTVKEFISFSSPISELVKKFDWMEAVLVAVVENKLNQIATVDGRAEGLSKEEGRAIGKSLAISLATTLTAQAAIDEWIHQFPALQQVDSEIKFFRPMLTKIGYKLVGDVRWGVKARVAVGAASSMTGKI